MFLNSHKSIQYLEYAAISVADKNLTASKAVGGREWLEEIPHKTTSLLLLGPGTSITNEACRLLAEEDVLVVFCSGGGAYPSLGMLNYTNNEYAQQWMRYWFDDRLELSKLLLSKRFSESCKFHERQAEIPGLLLKVHDAKSVEVLRGIEGSFVKSLYAAYAEKYALQFKRESGSREGVNAYLTHGNYLAYGLASLALHSLNIPTNFPLIHGETRDGGLIFDLADVVKDTYVLTQAFESFHQRHSQNDFRTALLAEFRDKKLLVVLISLLKKLISDYENNFSRK